MNKTRAPSLFIAFLLFLRSDFLYGDEFIWNLDIGIGSLYQRSLVKSFENDLNNNAHLLLGLELEYKGFFIEKLDNRGNRTLDRSVMGYRLHAEEESDISLVIANHHLAFGPTLTRRDPGARTPDLSGLENRKNDYFLALRYQSYWPSGLLILEVGRDVIAHRGDMAQVFYSHRTEHGNLDLYWNTGVNWYSYRLVDYYYGIRPAEANENRPAYDAGSGFRLHLGVTGVQPLSEKWILELGVGVNLYSSAFTDSPITRSQPELMTLAGVRYVF